MEILNQTISCDKCKGTGKVEIENKESTAGKEQAICDKCNGSGVVLDNKVGEIIKKYCPGIERSDFPKALQEIADHFEAKLKDSYDRGVQDGIAASKIK